MGTTEAALREFGYGDTKLGALDVWKGTFSEWLHIGDDCLLSTLMAVALSIDLPGDPLWMFLIAPPGGSKTEVLRSFRDERVFTISTLTPHSLISGLQTSKSKVDLLPELDNKLLIVKDFTSILTMSDNDRNEVFAQLRESYDGYLEKFFGSGVGKKSYNAQFGLVAGVTPVIDAYQVVHALLGERFLKFRIRTSENDAITKAENLAGKEESMRAQLQKATSECLNHFRQLTKREITISAQISKQIGALAHLVAMMRTGVVRDRQHRIRYAPECEIGTRLAKQLRKLALALACIHNKTTVTSEEYLYLKRVGADTVPNRRFDLVRELAKWCDDEDPTSKQLGSIVKLPTPTAREMLEDLWMLHLAERTGETTYRWALSDITRELLEQTGLVE